jgi:glycosyltransferase involved in cell wall biosynthesis
MHIAHLFSNRKWTAYSEPVVDLVLRQQRLGHRVSFICGKKTPGSPVEDSMEFRCERKGLETILWRMDKHFRFSGMRKDAASLRRFMDENKVDVVHAHMQNAHLVAAIALMKNKQRPAVVRSCYESKGWSGSLRARFMYRKCTGGLIVTNESAKRRVISKFKLSEEVVQVIEPGIDVEYFNPERVIDTDDGRFGFEKVDFVLGMVTRIRKDRRVDIAVEAVHKLAAQLPDLRLLIIGRGEEMERTQSRIKELGLDQIIRFGGYCREDRLVGAYRAMDALVYTVPGTDQSCRTVREAMAAGVPVIGSKLGFLPELIDDRVTGRLTDMSAESFANAIEQVYRERDSLEKMGLKCLEISRKRFSLDIQAQRTLGFYEKLLKSPMYKKKRA